MRQGVKINYNAIDRTVAIESSLDSTQVYQLLGRAIRKFSGFSADPRPHTVRDLYAVSIENMGDCWLIESDANNRSVALGIIFCAFDYMEALLRSDMDGLQTIE